jgi:PKD repeat protein
VYSVAVTTALIPYATNAGVVSYSTNSSGYGRVQHYSPQYNILIGNVDYDYAAAGVPNKTHPHSSAPDQCVTCHVPSYKVNGTNVTGHTFALDYYGCQTSCHSSYSSDALTAKINNLQYIESNNMVRVVSMLNQWALNKTAGTPLANYAQMAWEFTTPGMLSSPDATHKVGPPSAYSSKFGPAPSGTNDNLQLQIPQDIRMARFDLYMAYNDQSMGVHNPTYVQSLLDDAATRVSRQFTAANFSANTVAGFGPLTVKFTNLGTGITAYNWNFGDGGTATTANPTYVYNNPGVYPVTFTATAATGTETLVKTNYIRVLTAPTLSFVADQTSVAAGTTVNFTSTSVNTNNVFRWTWSPMLGVSGAPSFDIAGGSPNFSYTYTNAGTYSVMLRASCPGGANGSYNRLQVTNVAYITVH